MVSFCTVKNAISQRLNKSYISGCIPQVTGTNEYNGTLPSWWASDVYVRLYIMDQGKVAYTSLMLSSK